MALIFNHYILHEGVLLLIRSILPTFLIMWHFSSIWVRPPRNHFDKGTDVTRKMWLEEWNIYFDPIFYSNEMNHLNYVILSPLLFLTWSKLRPVKTKVFSILSFIFFFFILLFCDNLGDFEGAVKWYKKAFRLCPTLEDKKVT